MAKTQREKEQLDSGCATIANLARMIRPGKEWRIRYVEITPETLMSEFTEWDRARFNLNLHTEVIGIWDEDDHLLYVVYIEAESVMYALSRLMTLMADKF